MTDDTLIERYFADKNLAFLGGFTIGCYCCVLLFYATILVRLSVFRGMMKKRLNYLKHNYCAQCGKKKGIYPKSVTFCPIHKMMLRTRPKNNNQRQKWRAQTNPTERFSEARTPREQEAYAKAQAVKKVTP